MWHNVHGRLVESPESGHLQALFSRCYLARRFSSTKGEIFGEDLENEKNSVFVCIPNNEEAFEARGLNTPGSCSIMSGGKGTLPMTQEKDYQSPDYHSFS